MILDLEQRSAVDSEFHQTAPANGQKHLLRPSPNLEDAPLHILTCGSVDDGKSTLIGRLLWDAGDLPDDTRAAVLRPRTPDGEPALTLLVDGLAEEREQGITIDVAWRYFDTVAGRRFVIIDSPGHEQFTRNMASGASHADVAVMLVDARAGIKLQTRRHLAILHLVGVERIVLCVNKMDLVDWQAERFFAIEKEFSSMLAPLGFKHALAIPVAAKHGCNAVRRSLAAPWYSGPTLFEHLSAIPSHKSPSGEKFQMPVQMVIRDGDFRGLAGTVSAGKIRVGDEVRDVLTGKAASVRRIVAMDGDRQSAEAKQAIVLQLDRDAGISRGALLADAEASACLAGKLETLAVWLADAQLDAGRGLLLRTATDIVPVSQLKVRNRFNPGTLETVETDQCRPNDIIQADISLARAVAIDSFSNNRETGSFVLVDPITGATLAGGVVKKPHATLARGV
ncbi:MAG: sulfate adenylyltransferase [Rhodomicrobium sp.]|nr:sulfate adenylyltransferase [Rhodomicrobium sp.]